MTPESSLAYYLGLLIFWNQYLISIADCGFPGLPHGGLINGTDYWKNHNQTFPSGSAVSYSCHEPFKILKDGDPLRYCQGDGTWSGRRPFCEKNVAFGSQALMTDRNSSWHTDNLTDGKLQLEGQEDCPTLYPTDDVDASFEIALDQSYAIHKIIIHMPSPVVLVNDEMTLDSNVCSKVKHKGSSVIYDCSLDDENGDSSMKRGRKVQFSSSGSQPISICEVVIHHDPDKPECGHPEKPANGEAKIIDKAPFPEIKYSCNDGYQLNTEQPRTCLGRHWQGDQPVCTSLQPQSVEIEYPSGINSAITVESSDSSLLQPEFNPNSPVKPTPMVNSPENPSKCEQAKIANGKYTVLMKTGGSRTHWYFCIGGYKLEGSAFRDCINGILLGQQPVCVPEFSTPIVRSTRFKASSIIQTMSFSKRSSASTVMPAFGIIISILMLISCFSISYKSIDLVFLVCCSCSPVHP